MNCDFCCSKNLYKAYKPIGSLLDTCVFICKTCGLSQSSKTTKKSLSKKKRISGGADWGNIRYGKGFRVFKTIKILKNKMNLKKINKCLDVGSNRGEFINSLSKLTNCDFIGIEPDKKLKTKYNNKKVKIIYERFENITISQKFDLIHCSHTLEHLDSPSFFFKKISKNMTNKSILYLEVPDIKIIKSKNCLEEYFIDKHTFHFSDNDIKNYLIRYNFKIINKTSDKENAIYLIKKTNSKKKQYFNNRYNEHKLLIENYDKNISLNIKRIKMFKKKLDNMISKKQVILFWGAGRIFNIFQNHVDLKKYKSKIYVCDEYLTNYVKFSSGFKIHKPLSLKSVKFDKIFITARSFETDIRKKIKIIFNKDNRIKISSIFSN